MKRCAIFVFAALLGWVQRSAAATVGILETPSRSRLITEARFRLEGELLAVGLELENAGRPAGFDADPSGTLTRMAVERRLEAVIDLIGETAPLAAEVWLFDRDGHELHLTRVVPEPQAESASANLAIRTTDVIRANLLERGLPLRRSTDQKADSPRLEVPAPVEAPHEPASWGAQAGVSALSSLGESGLSIAPLLRLDWRATPQLVAHVTLSGLGTHPQLATAKGSAELSQTYALLGLQACHYCAAPLFPFAGIALGALRSTIEGRADAPLTGHAASQLSLLVDGNLGLSASLTERFSLNVAAHLQFAEPYVAVHFADQVVATLGRPNLSASLTLGAWL